MFLWVRTLTALDPAVSLSQYGHTRWGLDEGIPQDTVLSLRQTRDGYLWLATHGGLIRFDGIRFEAFTQSKGGLASNNVYSLWETPDGALWAGASENGLTRLQHGTATIYAGRQGLVHGNIRALAGDKSGTLWLGTIGGGVVRFAGDRFTQFAQPEGLPSLNVSCLLVDRTGVLWAGTFESGLAALQGDRFVQPDDGPTGLIWALTEDREGRIWAATLDGLWQRSEGRWRHLTRAEGWVGGAARTVFADRDGNLWVGLSRGGLARHTSKGLERFTSAEGLSDDAVLAMTEDREGNLWVATAAGIDRFRDEKFQMFASTQGLASTAMGPVYQDRRGELWTGTADGGLYRWGQGRWKRFPLPLADHAVLGILRDSQGNLWVCLEGGRVVRQTPGGAVSRYRLPPIQGRFAEAVSIGEDAKGAIWLATLGVGLLRWSGRDWEPYFARPDPALQYVTAAECDAQGNLWVSTYDAGVLRVGTDGRTTRWTAQDGLAGNGVRTLYVDHAGNVWLGLLAGGLALGRNGRFRSWRKSDCPLDGVVLGIAEDGLGHIWLSTTRGVVRVRHADLLRALSGEALTPEMRLYGRSDGLRSISHSGYVRPTVLRARDGLLWFATSKGLARIDPGRIRSNSQIPPVAIEQVSTERGAQAARDKVTIAPGSSRLEITYTALSLTAPERIPFQYRLDGYDADWVQAGGRRAAYYTNLSPGTYRFRVRAANNDGLWNEAGAAVLVALLPYPWQTWWFRLLVVAVGGGVIAQSYRSRLRGIEVRFGRLLAERRRMAHEIHDSLFQGFAGVTLLIEGAARRLPAFPEDARSLLQRAQEQTDQSLTRARRALWDMRSPLVKGVDLAAALRTVGHSLVPAPVRFELRIKGRRRLSRDEEGNLFRIAEEALQNAVQHGQPSRVTVQLQLGIPLRLSISDDGSGFLLEEEWSRYGGRWGLLGMRERAEQIGGKLRIDTFPGRGTTVQVEVP